MVNRKNKMSKVRPNTSIYNKYKLVNFTHKLKRYNGLKTKACFKLTASKLQQLENVRLKDILIKG